LNNRTTRSEFAHERLDVKNGSAHYCVQAPNFEPAWTNADQLARRGMAVSVAETRSFRTRLETSGFYSRWKTAFGPTAWELLENHTGKLA